MVRQHLQDIHNTLESKAMEVWQIVSPVRILRRLLQNLPKPYHTPVPYTHPSFEEHGLEALHDVAAFYAIREQGKPVHGFILVTLGEVVPRAPFFFRLVFYVVLVEEYAPDRDPEAGLQVVYRRMQVIFKAPNEHPRHELRCAL
jgi:hypothetical protein